MVSSSSPELPEQHIAGRFDVVGVVGAGGMATVYEVTDTATGRRVALKRLHVQADSQKRQRTIELFEREFHTLAQLAHPRIVEVYDYGVDAMGPYYTMELLDGGELAAMAPEHWRRVCAIGRDIGAALSLVHSRRLVYRDLNPRNVRCTSVGMAKLIDFGAMSAMGPNRQIVGTPAYCAPEALNFEPLDARTDLYSLGATLYFALTGKHAFPVHSFEQMRAVGDARPIRPAEYVTSVPSALDELVMELLHPEPGVRPANVTEVVERLAVIEGRTFDDLPAFTQAYLSTPLLVGREAARNRVRERIAHAQRFKGGVVIFESAAGLGRSRMLDACRIEAKLMGVLTVSADANDGQRDYGVLQTLGDQLLMAAPELALGAARAHAPTLAHVLPSLLAHWPELELQVFDEPTRQRAAVFAALQAWFLAIGAAQPIVATVDDMHRVDEPSAALLGLLSRSSEAHGLLFVLSVEHDAPARAAGALQLLAAGPHSHVMRLSPLTASECEDLLRSVFGDVPNVQVLARRLYETGRGNPRDTMQLAQDLVERKLARYRAGGWTLPDSFDDGVLPLSMASAQRARIQALDPRALAVAQALTLTLDRALMFEECQLLCQTDSPADMLQALTRLQAAQIARVANEMWAIDQRSFIAPLRETMDARAQIGFHLSLAQIFARRGNEEFRRAQQLQRAERPSEALDVMVAFAIATTEQTNENPQAFSALATSLPDDWLDFFVEMLRLGAELGRRPADVHALRIRFLGLVNVMGVPSVTVQPILRELLTVLARCSGLADCAELDPALDPGARVRAAMAATQQRYEQLPESQRIVPLGAALKQLTRTVIGCCGVVSSSLDHTLAMAIPSLAPLAPLSPALALVERLRAGAFARVSGQFEAACVIYRELLEFAARPDRAGIDPSNHRYMVFGVMAAIGLMEANFGLRSSSAWADQIESDPLYQVSAYQIRMVQALWEGRVHDADKLRERFELLRIQTGPRQLSDGPYLIGRVTANAVSDDLTRIKQTGEEIARLAQRHAAWWPVHEYALGEYDRIRGRTERALAHLESALELTSAGTHPIWPHAAAAQLRVLRSLKQSERAVELGQGYLEAAGAAGLGAHIEHVRLQLALSLADRGRSEEAAQLLSECLQCWTALGCDGLILALVHEARAQMALATNDSSAYETAMHAFAELTRAGQGRVLRAKQERLKRAARAVSLPGSASVGDTVFTAISGTQVHSMLLGCTEPEERAQRTLDLLRRRSGAHEGCLYLNTTQGLQLSARTAGWVEHEQLAVPLRQLVRAQTEDQELETRTEEEDADDDAADMTQPRWVAPDGTTYHLVPLSHQTPYGQSLSGIAVLAAPRDAAYENPLALAASLSRALLDAGDLGTTTEA